jgi:hypothetical protein
MKKDELKKEEIQNEETLQSEEAVEKLDSTEVSGDRQGEQTRAGAAGDVLCNVIGCN